MNIQSDNIMNSDSDTQSFSQTNNKIIDKKNIVDRINNLNSRRCNLKIFKIIYNNKINYSKNDNGIFFNINNLNNNQLSEINNILSYYEKKKNNDNTSTFGDNILSQEYT
jgi:hypothetical protein